MATTDRSIAVLLLPRSLNQFILREQAEELLRSDAVVALTPPRVPYGAIGRLPCWAGRMIAKRQAKRTRFPGPVRVVLVYHPFQYPLAAALLAEHPGSELWYCRWDRYEAAYDADPKLKMRLAELHEQTARRSSFTYGVSDTLVEIEKQAGRDAELVTLSADSFPAPTTEVIAVCLGQLGHRNDWRLLHTVVREMPELTLLLIGEWHDAECSRDPSYVACRNADNIVWLGRQPDAQAARIIGCADVGILPFERSAFNEAGLPYRILKYARLGRRTISPDLKGVATWSEAVITADSADDWIAALRSQAGKRLTPDSDLQQWAFAQSAPAVNAPLREQLEALGIDAAPTADSNAEGVVG